MLFRSRLCIKNKSMMIILKTTYDEDKSRFAPGRILLYLVLEREFNLRRIKTIEFYTNATEDQVAWSTGQRSISNVLIFRNSFILSVYRFFNRKGR